MKKSLSAISTAKKLNMRNTSINIFKHAQSTFMVLLACDLDKAFTTLIFIAVTLLTCYAVGGIK